MFFLFHFFLFCLNLSISFIEIIIGLKDSSSISFKIFSSLSFNSPSFNPIKSFTYSKRLFFTFKNLFPRVLLYFCFYNLDALRFPFIYVQQKMFKIFKQTYFEKIIIFKLVLCSFV